MLAPSTTAYLVAPPNARRSEEQPRSETEDDHDHGGGGCVGDSAHARVVRSGEAKRPSRAGVRY